MLKASVNRIHAADLFLMATIATGSELVQLPSSSKLPLFSISGLNTVSLMPRPQEPTVPVLTKYQYFKELDWKFLLGSK